MKRWGALAAVVALTFAGACSNGDDDDAAPAEGSGSASMVSACEPVGEGGGTPVEVTLDEWSVAASPASVPAGKVTFDVRNAGAEAHELVIVKATSTAELTVVEGKVDEDALPEGAFIGEVEAFPAGQDCEGTFELAAGSYVLFCNIVEEEHEGERESHYEEGMLVAFEVR